MGGHFQINSLHLCEQMSYSVLHNSATLNGHKDSEVFSASSEHVTTASCMLEYACFCQNCSASEAVIQTDCDCCGGGKCNEAACVPRMNNQHPSEVMGGSRIRGSLCGGGGGGSWWGGGGVRRWHGSSWNLAFCEAPWLMEGSKVNSNAPKLYLIFIHMDVEG